MCESDLDTLLQKLEADGESVIEWFKNNYMQLNQGKCHFLLTGCAEDNTIVTFGNTFLNASNLEKLLGLLIDKKLRFYTHIKKLCTEAEKKVGALNRLNRIISVGKRKILYNSYIQSFFEYGSLVWMFCTREENNRINRLHERVLRIIYDDSSSTFEELLERDGAVTIHVRNIRKVAIEMYKVFHGVAPEVIRDLFNIIESSMSERKFERKRDITVFLWPNVPLLVRANCLE